MLGIVENNDFEVTLLLKGTVISFVIFVDVVNASFTWLTHTPMS